MKDSRVDPTTSDNYAIRIASFHGRTAVIQVNLRECNELKVIDELLKDPRVDPSIDNNFPVRVASDNGHLDLVKRWVIIIDIENWILIRLLRDTRVEMPPCSGSSFGSCTMLLRAHLQANTMFDIFH